jgi:membrane-bound metal-dependent hydrolase YbcI (DUF457 family)
VIDHGRRPGERSRGDSLRRLGISRADLLRRLALSRETLALAAILLALADWGSRVVGNSLFPGAPLDELAHALTTLLVLWALGGRAQDRFLIPALIASVLIDVDHVPGRLGTNWLTAGTQRPYTHSLLAIAMVVVVALAWRRRRDPLLGIAIGLAIHFWRDMAESDSGVPLLWPFSDHSFRVQHGVYIATVAAFVLVDAVRCWSSVRRGFPSQAEAGPRMSRLSER